MLSALGRSGLKIWLIMVAVIIAVVAGGLLFSAKARHTLLSAVSPGYRASARLQTCKSNMRSMAFRMQDYVNEHGDHFPPRAGEEWILEVYPFIANLRVLYCPENTRGLAALNQAEKQVSEKYIDRIRRGVASLDVRDQLRKNHQPLTDYWMPEAVAGKKWEDLTKDTVILEEHGPGHEGKWLRIHKDFSFTLVPAGE
jgi:hypothetical protein